MTAPPGRAGERTALAWWRTAQLAIGASVLFAKFGTDRSAFGWVATGAAVTIAVVAWLVARTRAHDTAGRPPTPVPSVALAVGGLIIVLAAAVVCAVVVAP